VADAKIRRLIEEKAATHRVVVVMSLGGKNFDKYFSKVCGDHFVGLTPFPQNDRLSVANSLRTFRKIQIDSNANTVL
jgi:hypothetical protein